MIEHLNFAYILYMTVFVDKAKSASFDPVASEFYFLNGTNKKK